MAAVFVRYQDVKKFLDFYRICGFGRRLSFFLESSNKRYARARKLKYVSFCSSLIVMFNKTSYTKVLCYRMAEKNQRKKWKDEDMVSTMCAVKEKKMSVYKLKAAAQLMYLEKP